MGDESMSDDYSRETLEGVSVIRLHRQVSIDRLLEIVMMVATDGVSDRRLWFVANYFDFSRAEVQRVAELGRRLWPGPGQVAYVADEAVFYGLLRMFAAYRHQDGYETGTFLDEESALEWLST